MNRRKFMNYMLFSYFGLISSSFYLDDKKMQRLKPRRNRIPADLHVHLHENSNPGDVKEALTQNGLVGLTVYSKPNRLLSYYDLKKYKEFKEIDPGILGELNYKGRIGYILNAQEIVAKNHISALGCKEKIPHTKDPFEAVKEIHKQGGLAILNHPYITVGGLMKYRLINREEEKKLYKLENIVDEVEIFNGQSINLIPFIWDMNKANELAGKFARDLGFKGIASSDTHYKYEQVLTSGIYIPKENLTFKKLKEYIETKNFESEGDYISRKSFLSGNFLASIL